MLTHHLVLRRARRRRADRPPREPVAGRARRPHPATRVAPDALCREHPEVRFILEHGETAEAARGVCSDCLVRAECLATALEDPLTAGVWGGTTAAERKALRRTAA